MSDAPVVAFGLPLYNSVDRVGTAVDSLLAQTRPDIAIVAVDDGSTDGTADLVRARAELDPRLQYRRNERRLGLVANWRRCYEVTRAHHPGARYFAWASDHDRWSPRWAEQLSAELDAHPEAVLAYPLAERLSPAGEQVGAPWRWDTAGHARSASRVAAASWRMTAGDMIYGLLRPQALERAGIFPPVLLPDRLVLAQLAALGEFRQVDELLWHRYMSAPSTAASQRRSFFPDGCPPYARLPWWLQHGAAMTWQLGIRGRGRPVVARPAGFGLAGLHAALSAAFAFRQHAHRIAGARARRRER